MLLSLQGLGSSWLPYGPHPVLWLNSRTLEEVYDVSPLKSGALVISAVGDLVQHPGVMGTGSANLDLSCRMLWQLHLVVWSSSFPVSPSELTSLGPLLADPTFPG